MTTTITPTSSAASGARKLPSALTVGLARGRHELRCFFRSKESVLFTLAFPVMLLVLFGSIFKKDTAMPGVSYSQVLLAGIMASGLSSVSFVSLAIGIATERDAGDLLRLAATPMPRVSYFIGKSIQVFVTMCLELAIIIALGVVLYDLKLPSSAGRWLTFAWVTVLGSLAMSLLGIAMSSFPKNAKSAAPIVNLPFVALQFISGVFVNYAALSPTIRGIASFFPLKWIAQGYRSVFLPDKYLKVEAGGSWQHGSGAIVLCLWIAGASIICIRTFRWVSSKR
jgi:ABC-2 type transport system permease protein